MTLDFWFGKGDPNERYSYGRAWTDLVGETGADWSSSSTGTAKKVRQRVHLAKSSSGLVIQLDLTGVPQPKKDEPPCASFYLWPKTSPSPQFSIYVCMSSRIKRPQSDIVSVQKGVVIHSTKEWTTDQEFQAATGISGHTANSNNWLLMAQQAALDTGDDCLICMGARPLLHIIPAPVEPRCATEIMGTDNPQHNCSKYDVYFPLANAELKKPLFFAKVPRLNYTCFHTTIRNTGGFNKTLCDHIVTPTTPGRGVIRADIWFHCGGNQLHDRVPYNASGLCALVTLLLPVKTYKLKVGDITNLAEQYPYHTTNRVKRKAMIDPDPTYIDAIGVPRGVPSDYKIADQLADGFTSIICPWCVINKNSDRINYIHYNIQRLGNLTHAGLKAVSEQLKATSLMAYQNRMALDMLLAEKGGVCAMFGEQCCTFIPNNTAADGTLQIALDGLKTLNSRMKDQSGIDGKWDEWMSVFGKYKTLVTSVLVSMAVFAAILTLCGCCCIPCIRSMVDKIISTAIAPSTPLGQQLALLSLENNPDIEEGEEEAAAMDTFPTAPPVPPYGRMWERETEA
ncbi:uncharacterized protein LOC117550103 [Gymnodraco acuticeps]|uniref:Uncharacterized protein LOC117550103 n=1 Tax=Gymnodraco acuticeps TaxID=8218 RepID=A0A6P8UZY4_GYMAC|nr:uncharacterized protein LOC117550103 [Gymnodraco acuticeps]XP_034078320.1 uncharacterized protein LOC117550103 [Gymnodraco acuticeps]